MPRDLFGDVTRPSISVGTRKWYTVPASLLTHSAVVFAIVAVPLVATDVLPTPWQKIGPAYLPVVPTPPPVPPKPRPADVKPAVNPNAAPLDAPSSITPETAANLDTSFQDADTGIVGGDENVDRIIAAPPPPIIAPPPQALRVGGAIRQPQRVRHVQPVYPPIAQSARIEGIVIIEATIGEDGQVLNARVLRSVPLLDQAALDAVRQWHYTPTQLNGVSVPVIMSVTVQFTLSR